MSTKRLLQSADMEKSPVRKKAKYNSPLKECWSLMLSEVKLNDLCDCGVGVLDSDTDTQSDDDETVKGDKIIKTCKSSPSDTTPTSEEKKSDNEWDKYVIAKSDISSSNLDYFTHLSDEVILHIFHFLPKQQLVRIAQVCTRFHRLSKDESLWTRMDVSNRVLHPGALGEIISHQVVILRLSMSEICAPSFSSECRAASTCFQSRLLYLDLSMAHISPEDLVLLFSKCQRLKKLSLEHVTMDDIVLKELSNNTELEVLNLANAQGIQFNGMKYLLNSCTKLREINISWTFLNSLTVDFICAHLPKTLDRLNIAGCRKLLTDSNVCNLVKCCPNLRELDLSDCTGLTENSIQDIVRLQDLNFLALSRCYLIPYRALFALKTVQTLVYLDVHGGYIDNREIKRIQDVLGTTVHINKFKFSSVGRPTVGSKRSSIWNLRDMACCTADPDTLRSREIDKYLIKEGKREQEFKKLLLLGTGESGKSTIIKQMKIIHINGFSDEERLEKRKQIRDNIHESIYAIITVMTKLKPPLYIQSALSSVEVLMAIGPHFPDEYSEEYFYHVEALWNDSNVKKAFQRSNEYQLIDCAEYFLDRIGDIKKDDYIPSDQDILHCRLTTTTISKIEFEMKVAKKYGGGKAKFWMFDVGGQRGHRDKWISVFEGIHAVLFLMAASDYDLKLRENEDKNRLEEAFEVFSNILWSRYLMDAGVIVFLNKQDMFQRKIESGIKLEDYFPEYNSYKVDEKEANPDDDYENAKYFMRQKLLDIKDTPPYFDPEDKISRDSLYIHFTTATDTKNVKLVFDSIHDKILQDNLSTALPL